MATKLYNDKSVLEASRERISNVFDNFDKHKNFSHKFRELKQ